MLARDLSENATMAHQLYRNTTIGHCLQESLDELMQYDQLPPALAMKVLLQFDKAISAALANRVKSRLSFKASGRLSARRATSGSRGTRSSPDTRASTRATGRSAVSSAASGSAARTTSTNTSGPTRRPCTPPDCRPRCWASPRWNSAATCTAACSERRCSEGVQADVGETVLC
ncbi:uncharacterized protein LOC122363407 isoform X2 [Amphibalanus amphitrite]|uniref:uncharacterized protein LOC122363407 isoform X2 n=1 Tax=Amphibalanus amphitrite TaxID=1232801 RepID=UPI001C9261CC|nr:uncharacterized protein LOC122363407 isoform X2 [Amphibalanus amphitrite]